MGKKKLIIWKKLTKVTKTPKLNSTETKMATIYIKNKNVTI